MTGIVSSGPTAMTQMSDPRCFAPRAVRTNPLIFNGRSRLARALHDLVDAVSLLSSLVLALVLVGCFIPPSLAVDNSDAGVNSPPSILSVRSDQQELPEFSTLTFEVNTTSTLSLTLLDTDVDDTLYPKVFVDYGRPDPTPPRSSCTPAAGGAAERSSTCDLHGLCVTADIGQTRMMSVFVFDRQVLDSGTPVYQAMPPGGLSTNRVFFLLCQQAAP
jgi:hypothetical protein